MDSRIKNILVLIYVLITLILVAACGIDFTQNLTANNTPTEVPTVEPTPTIDPRLDGYDIVPVLDVRYILHNSNFHWFSGPMVVLTNYRELSQLIENKNELTPAYKDELKTTYDDDYFNEKSLMVVQFEHSGSDRVHDFLGVIIENNKLYPVIEHGYKGFGTVDISLTIIFVELDNDYTKKEPGEILTIDKYNDGSGTFKPQKSQ